MKNNYTYLKIENFRGIQELEIKFKDGVNEIHGDNGVGKTTILDSITWVLFGKNLADKKSGFTISPIINAIERNDIETKVKLIINDDFIVIRTWKDKKTTLQCGFLENGVDNIVSVTQTEFKKILSDRFIDEEEFKALSNINYIPSLKWQELKDFIFNLIGEIKDEEVLLNGDFDNIAMSVRTFGIEKATEQIKTTERDLNESIKTLEIEINNTNALKNKYVSDDKESEELKKEKEEIEKYIDETNKSNIDNTILMTEYERKAEEQHNIIQEIKTCKNSILMNEEKIKTYNELYTENAYDAARAKNKALTMIKMDIDNVKEKINHEEEHVKNLNEVLEYCREEAKEYANKEVKIENESCPSCGQKLPEEKIKETLDILKKQHEDKVEEYRKQIQDYLLKIDALQKQIEEDSDLLNELEENYKATEREDYTGVVEETEKQKEYRVLREELEIENEKLRKRIQDLKSKVEEVNKPDVKNVDLTSYISRLNEINDKLSTTITLSKLEEDIRNKEAELSAKKISKEVNYKKMQEIIAFNNAKAELLKQRVRKYFKIVEFITSETTGDGNQVETFKLAYNGIAYEDLNQSMKIILCLDLLMGIQNIKDKHICILIDNGEQITRLPEVDTQLIVTYVKKQDIKKVEVI